jgi:hypothetical protein
MAKSDLRIKARKLRRSGSSLKEIAEELEVAKSSVSIWCRDIELTKQQISRLEEKQSKASYAGRLKGAKKQQEMRLEKIRSYEENGRNDINELNQRDFFLAGVALYWGEGNKKGNRVGFSNSDPNVVKFMVKWFEDILGVDRKRFRLQLGVNQIYRRKEKEMLKYWSDLTCTSLDQFVKTSFKKTRNKKFFEDSSHYNGTLRITITKSSDLLYQIWGWLKALSDVKPG